MKRFIAYCFLLLSCLHCFSQEQVSTPHTNITESSVNWLSVEQNLNNLEQNLQMLTIDNENLQVNLNSALLSLEIQKKYLSNLSLHCKDLENKLESSEQTMKRWRLACGITVTVAVPTIAILVAIAVNK